MKRTPPSRSVVAASFVASLLLAPSACRSGEPKPGALADATSRTTSAPPTVAPSAAIPTDTTLAAFWTRFRDAVSARDTTAILALTDRAFATRGEMDEDPWIPRDSTAVVAILDSLLSTDPGLGREATMRAMVLATDTTGLSRLVAAGELRVGSFVFEARGGSWRFVKAYLP